MNLNDNNTRPEFEIIGLHHNTEGRRCTLHTHCGMHVYNNDVLRLVFYVAQVRPDKAPEDAIKLVKIEDGIETCTVGFVPRSFAKMKKLRDRIGKCCMVLELYSTSDNHYKQKLSEKNFGMASCIFIDDVPRQE
jgi:hypothetical protein